MGIDDKEHCEACSRVHHTYCDICKTKLHEEFPDSGVTMFWLEPVVYIPAVDGYDLYELLICPDCVRKFTSKTLLEKIQNIAGLTESDIKSFLTSKENINKLISEFQELRKKVGSSK